MTDVLYEWMLKTRVIVDVMEVSVKGLFILHFWKEFPGKRMTLHFPPYSGKRDFAVSVKGQTVFVVLLTTV